MNMDEIDKYNRIREYVVFVYTENKFSEDHIKKMVKDIFRTDIKLSSIDKIIKEINDTL